MPTLELSTETPVETEQLGRQIGHYLKGGEVIELVSDLGGGKTTLVRGVAEGVGSQDHVSSPTFTVSKVYKTDKLSLHHFDFYRLSEPGVVTYELAEVVQDPQAVVLVEWAEGVQSALPEDRMTINLRRDAASEQKRDIEISYADKLSYLVQDLVPHSSKVNT